MQRSEQTEASGATWRSETERKVCFYIGHLSNPLDRSERFTPGRPVHSGTNSTSLGHSSHAATTCRYYLLTFAPPSIDRYSFIQLSELGHHGENENTQTLKR